MTQEEYRQSGFQLSAHITQAIIDRAEKDVQQAYIEPIMPQADTTEEGAAKEAVMQLSFLLILQRSIFATRSGAKEKQTPQSQTADRWNLLSEEGATCLLKLKRLANVAGVEKWQSKVTDICGILFQTQYFYI